MVPPLSAPLARSKTDVIEKQEDQRRHQKNDPKGGVVEQAV
jgi:hypothetical protein